MTAIWSDPDPCPLAVVRALRRLLIFSLFRCQLQPEKCRSHAVGRLLAVRLIKGGLCSGSSPFGSEEEPKAASVAAAVGSSKVGQTERRT